jgi:hypothetical protein
MRAANVPGPLHIHCVLIIILSQCKATTPKNGFAAFGLWNPIVPICSSAFQSYSNAVANVTKYD